MNKLTGLARYRAQLWNELIELLEREFYGEYFGAQAIEPAERSAEAKRSETQRPAGADAVKPSGAQAAANRLPAQLSVTPRNTAPNSTTA